VLVPLEGAEDMGPHCSRQGLVLDGMRDRYQDVAPEDAPLQPGVESTQLGIDRPRRVVIRFLTDAMDGRGEADTGGSQGQHAVDAIDVGLGVLPVTAGRPCGRWEIEA
jgi:hypothetical protein